MSHPGASTREPRRRPTVATSSRGPRRPGVGPVLVLCVLAALPALFFFSVWRWAEGRASAADAAEPAPVEVVPRPDPVPTMSTGLLSLRRTPNLLSRQLNLDAFVAEAAVLPPLLNERSCLAITVDGVPVTSVRGDLAVIPASTQKLLVAAAALDVLGPDHRYTTTVTGPAPSAGVVSGDVYLVGGGDPLLSSGWYPTSGMERYPVFNETSLDALADQLVAAGITRIDGRVLGDATRYDDERFAPGWGAGVAGLEAGPYDALMVNDSRVLGEELRAERPDAAAAREFAQLLANRGIAVAGADAGAAPGGLTELGSIDSAPMTDVIAEMLTNSDNNTAELLVKEIGLVAGDGGTRQAGLQVIMDRLVAWGVDVGGVVLGDGSGLSLENRLTCDALVAVLARSGADGPIAAGLAVAGESGTLADVFTEHPIRGRLLGKTGTLNNPPFNEDPPAVKALAGYVPVDGGGSVEYALVLNGPTISDQSEYRAVWDALADVLVTYPSSSSPAALGPR